MKKSILNLGKSLSKEDLKQINGAAFNAGCRIEQVNDYGTLCSACCRFDGNNCVPDPTQICF